MPFGKRKGGGLSRKSNVTKRKRDERQRNFMDLTPSQDDPSEPEGKQVQFEHVKNI